MKTNTIYDKQFYKIENLFHFPWVGSDYPDNPIKVLVLGESHYAVDDNGKYCEEEYNKNKSNKFYTREILDKATNQDDIWPMFKGLYKLFEVTPYTAEKSFWNKVAFGNFVQEPMQSKDAKPKIEDYKNAWFCLLDIIDIIKPDICLFIGISSWISNGFVNIENKGKIDLCSDSEIISRSKPWKAEITTKTGIKTRAIAIHHTSQGFNPDLWRDYLNRKEPEILSLISSVN